MAGLLVATLVISTLSGCAGLQQSAAANPGTATAICAGGGAALGAAAGALIDKRNPLTGAILGGLVGAVAGGAACFAVAKAGSSTVKDYGETQTAVGYRPTQGTLVRVQRLQVEPATVSPGQRFTWRSEYVVMTPQPDLDIPVVETRIVSAFDERANQWKEIGRTQTPITAKPGTRLDQAEMTMPSNPPARRYLLTFHVDQNGVADQKSQDLFVVTRQASLPQSATRMTVETPDRGSRIESL